MLRRWTTSFWIPLEWKGTKVWTAKRNVVMNGNRFHSSKHSENIFSLPFIKVSLQILFSSLRVTSTTIYLTVFFSHEIYLHCVHNLENTYCMTVEILPKDLRHLVSWHHNGSHSYDYDFLNNVFTFFEYSCLQWYFAWMSGVFYHSCFIFLFRSTICKGSNCPTEMLKMNVFPRQWFLS